MPENRHPPLQLTVQQLARATGWAERTLYLHADALGAVRVGATVRFPVTALRARWGDALVDEIVATVSTAEQSDHAKPGAAGRHEGSDVRGSARGDGDDEVGND